MTTKYNLSYHTQNMIVGIITDISFDSENEAILFIQWFNNVVNANARVSMVDVCNKLKIDIPEDKEEVFSEIGFNRAMDPVGVIYSTYKNGYVVIFPWLIDFMLNRFR